MKGSKFILSEAEWEPVLDRREG